MLTWTVGSLAVNQTYVATMIVRVTSVSQAIVNVARVGSTTLPPTDSNRVVIPVQPTAVTLASFNVATASRGMQVTWRTALERNTFGFYVLRSATGNRADAVQVNAEMVVAAGPNTYSLLDESGSAGNAYWLQEVELDGTRHDYGPVIAQAPLPGAAASQPNPQPAMPAPVAGVLPKRTPAALVSTAVHGVQSSQSSQARSIAPCGLRCCAALLYFALPAILLSLTAGHACEAS